MYVPAAAAAACGSGSGSSDPAYLAVFVIRIGKRLW